MGKLRILALVGFIFFQVSFQEAMGQENESIQRYHDRVNAQFLVLYGKEEKGKELRPFLKIDEKALLIDKYGDTSNPLIWKNLEEKYKREVKVARERRETYERLVQKNDIWGMIWFYLRSSGSFGIIFIFLLVGTVLIKLYPKEEKVE